MLFNSIFFLFLFLPISLILSRIFGEEKKIILLLILSIIFYSFHSILNLVILLFSISLNFFFVKNLSKKSYFVPIILNLLILFIFKYATDIFNKNIFSQNFMLPLGISFFTFQQISYLLDNKFNNIEKHNFFEYAFYVSFFPQLIAGPIIRFRDIIHQIKGKYKINNGIYYHRLCIGFLILSIGLVKKVIFADTLAEFVDPIFLDVNAAQNNVSMVTAWIAIFCFMFQLYFDFSGYCDMALGMALMLGFKIPINFYSPFKSENISQFWSRWNITLTNFFTSILYNNSAIILGRKFSWINHEKLKFAITQIFPFFITFSVIGIWHGSGLNFLIFGLVHAFFLSVYYIFSKVNFFKINKNLSIFLTFLCVTLSFVFFRSENLNDSIELFKKLFLFENLIIPNSLFFLSEKISLLDLLSYGEVYYWQGTRTVIWITLSFIICFMFPNVSDIFSKYKISLQNVPQNQKTIQIPNPVIFLLMTLFIPITYLQSIPTFYEFLPTKISIVCFFILVLTILFFPKKTLRIRVDIKTCMISVLLMFISFLKIFTGRENEFIYFAF